MNSIKRSIVKVFKKDFACNSTVVEHIDYGDVIQLQGDQLNLTMFIIF